MNIVERALAIREGGQVQRAHTMQYDGPYNVAIHSYNALSLLLLLYPKTPSLGLIRAVMWHDVPERWTGDIPAPAKWASPKLKELLDKLEEKILKELGLEDLFKNLSQEELNWLNAVDLLELWIWSKEQIHHGNKNLILMAQRIIEVFNKRGDKTPNEVLHFIGDLSSVGWKRSVECNELIGENL